MLRVIECFAVTQGHSRSFAVTPLSGACVSPYQYFVVSMSYRGHSRSFEMAPFDRSHCSYWCSIVTMALSCIISDIKRDIGQNRDFFIPHLHSTTPLVGPRQNIAITFGIVKIYNGVATQRLKKFDDMFSHNIGVWRRDRQTDRHLATA